MVSRENQYQVAIIEHDRNNDDLCVWTYPSLTQNQIILCEKHSSSLNTDSSFIYFKLKADWIYMKRFNISSIPDLTAATIVCISRVFNPAKFLDLLKIFEGQYMAHNGDPPKILEIYLNLFMNGTYSGGFGMFDMKSISSIKEVEAFTAVSALKDLIRDVGIESVILWNAVLLKKRILVVDDEVQKVLEVTRSLPQLAWHRKDWSVLRPLILDDAIHVEDLESVGVYIAGASSNTAATIISRGDLFDVIVSLTDHRITVSNSATGTMKMCTIHKDVANIMVEVASNEDSKTQTIIDVIHKKTSAILANLQSLAVVDEGGKKRIPDAAILESTKNEATQQWLRRLAIAENLLS